MRVRNETNLFRAVVVALGLFTVLSSLLQAQDATERPNIVLIYADDLGFGDVGCYGATKVSTPNIDQLASAGRKFTDAHSPSAVCTPSRYSLLTGRYGWRANIWGPLALETPLLIPTDVLTTPRLLQQHGYSTACVGKWHLGFGETETDWNKPLKPGPLEIGFDYYYGVPFVNSGPPFVYVENHHVVGLDPSDPFVLRKKDDPLPPSPTQTFPAKHGADRWAGAKRAHELYRDEMVGTTLTGKAVEWMRTHAKEKQDQPFFLYLATTNIHHPFTPHPRFQGTSQCGRYGDFIHELDFVVGEVLKTLDELKLADDTLVIFTSDNGGM
ncbi:MAG: sulfatase-like hydrolase/transferase, partial [Bythopirellula sp.]